jgi:hypothetical protein
MRKTGSWARAGRVARINPAAAQHNKALQDIVILSSCPQIRCTTVSAFGVALFGRLKGFPKLIDSGLVRIVGTHPSAHLPNPVQAGFSAVSM